MQRLVLVYGLLDCASKDVPSGETLLFMCARLPPQDIGMIVDKGYDFPSDIESKLKLYGDDMWFFRPRTQAQTTRALNIYKGDQRGYVSSARLRR